MFNGAEFFVVSIQVVSDLIVVLKHEVTAIRVAVVSAKLSKTEIGSDLKHQKICQACIEELNETGVRAGSIYCDISLFYFVK